MDLFTVVVLDQGDLHDACEVWIQLINDRIRFFIGEVHVLRTSNFIEELSESFSSAEVVDPGGIERISLQEGDIKTVCPNVVCKLLDRLFRPSLNTSKEFS